MSIEQIYASLNQLAASVDFLEQEMTRKEAAQEAEKAKAQQAAKAAPQGKSLPGLPGQNDLFGEWVAPGGTPANKPNAATLAKKLDNAIENVQWLLKTGT